jgi:hypothetical protein
MMRMGTVHAHASATPPATRSQADAMSPMTATNTPMSPQNAKNGSLSGLFGGSIDVVYPHGDTT